MPLKYRYDSSLGAVLTTVTGTMEESDVLEHLRSMRDDPEIPSGFTEIVDFSSADDFAVKASGAGRIAFLVPELQDRKKYKGPIFYAPTESAKQMARMFQVLLENLGIDVGIHEDWEELMEVVKERLKNNST